MYLLPYLLDLTKTVKQAIITSLHNSHYTDIVKKKDIDFTWNVDRIAEQKAVEFIKSKKVSTRLISEEIGIIDIGKSPEIIVVLDPLDGSLNFTHSIPFCSVSAAAGPFTKNFTLNTLKVGVVNSIFSDDIFYAQKGSGAFKNNQLLSLRDLQTSVTTPVLSLYIYGVKKIHYHYQPVIRDFKVRTLGSIALEICYIANKSLDAVLDLRDISRIVDIAAAKIILEEAGGIVKLMNKGAKTLTNLNQGFSLIAARNDVIGKQLQKIIIPHN